MTIESKDRQAGSALGQKMRRPTWRRALWGVSFTLLGAVFALMGEGCQSCARGAKHAGDLESQPAPGVSARPSLPSGASASSPLSTSATAPAGNASQTGLPALGTNLGGINDWAEEWPFSDAFKQSRVWISGVKDGAWADNQPLDVDAKGWVRSLKPGQIARTIMLTEGHFPTGDYVVSWKGRGKIEYMYDGEVVSSSANREVVRVRSNRKMFGINLLQTDPGDPLRDLRVWLPGGACHGDAFRACTSAQDCGGAACDAFEQHPEQHFNPAFLQGLRGYGAIRLMDWFQTNETKVTDWSSRPHVDDARYTVNGVPLEIAVELVKVLGVDGWFTIPHTATDDYVREMAKLVKAGMPAGRTAYFEYSNEVWNGGFQAARYAAEQGKRLGLSADGYEAQLLYQSRRSVQIFQILETVYQGSKDFSRVLGCQAGNDWGARKLLEFENAARHTDAIAIAPYFGWSLGATDASRVRGMNLDGVFDELSRKAVPEAVSNMEKFAALARSFGLKLIAYEGGQHLVIVGGEDDATLNGLFDAANRDRRMKDLYLKYLEAWKQAGGLLFMHYQAAGPMSKWGRWGSREWMTQPRAEAPKYDALMDFNAAHRRWW